MPGRRAIPRLGKRLAPAGAKFRRADRHLRELRREVSRFTDREPFTVGTGRGDTVLIPTRAQLQAEVLVGLIATRTNSRVLTSEIILDVTLTPRLRAPALRWGTIVGDIAHNLASALETLVAELAMFKAGLEHGTPKPRSRKWHRLAFPYATTRDAWERASADRLALVDHAVHAKIEDVQPFRARERTGEDAQRHPLWVLHELWNRDKHETVNLATAGSEYKDSRVFGSGAEFAVETLATYGCPSVIGETKVAKIRVHLPRPVDVRGRFDGTINANFGMRLLFGTDAPAEGDGVLEKLGDARNTVADLLNAFE